MSKKGKRAVSPIIATILLVAITVVLAAVLYVLVSGYLGSTGAKPASIGMASSTPTSEACSAAGGTGATLVYYEGISITSTSSTVTTNTFGIKVVPTSGTSNPTIALAQPTAAGTCSGTGYYGVLYSASSTVLGCWTADYTGTNSAGGWGVVAANCIGSATALTAVTLAGGMTLDIFIWGSNPAGAYTIQAYGLGGATVSGSADL